MTVRSVLRHITFLTLGVAAVLSAMPSAEAAGNVATRVAQPEVAVPHMPVPAPVPGGGGIAGCWSAQRPIYGPYAFSFCSNGAYGSYTVRGGGLYCEGRVSVAPGYGGNVTVRLSKSRCNNWTDWTADYLVCRTRGWYPGGGYVGGYKGGYANPEVAVPHVPSPRVPVPGGRLDCTYYPDAPGYHPISLAMSRR